MLRQKNLAVIQDPSNMFFSTRNKKKWKKTQNKKPNQHLLTLVRAKQTAPFFFG